MERRFAILIAERNPRVRKFLKREFVSDGFVVLVAENGNDLARIIRLEERLDLLILDNELPGFDEPGMVEQLANRVPHLPFVIHSFSTECVGKSLGEAAAGLVEKTGNIDGLRKTVCRVLRDTDPRRFHSSKQNACEKERGSLADPLYSMEARKA